MPKKFITNQSEFDNLIIEPKDYILLSGEFYGKLDINQDGVVVFGGCVKGSQLVTNWIDQGAGIYSKVMAEPKWLYIDSQSARLSRTSNFNVVSTLLRTNFNKP